jgi:hypothetical protein
MHLKILDSMLLRPMFFWIFLGSTTSLPSLERKLYYALHVHMNFSPCIHYCLLCSYTILTAVKFTIDASDFFSLLFYFLVTRLKVQISVVLERDNFLYVLCSDLPYNCCYLSHKFDNPLN